MSNSSRFVLPYQTVVGSTGAPLPGAQLFFYVTGTDTPAVTYADPALATPNANPVIANADGVFPNIFLDPAVTYKAVLEDSGGNQQWTADPVVGGASASSGFAPIGRLARRSTPMSQARLGRPAASQSRLCRFTAEQSATVGSTDDGIVHSTIGSVEKRPYFASSKPRSM